jgi:hypothetical protein
MIMSESTFWLLFAVWVLIGVLLAVAIGYAISIWVKAGRDMDDPVEPDVNIIVMGKPKPQDGGHPIELERQP